MHLPYLPSRKKKTEKQTIAFRGIHYGEGAAEGQLESSRNLTSERFPCMSQRAGRETGEQYQDATAIWYKDGQLVVNGTDLVYKGKVVGTVSPGKKQFANINTKVVIMPDKVVFDTKTEEVRGLGAEYTTVAATVFTGGDNESTLSTHIGSFVESIAGSGNVGGNDALGENNPTFRGDKPPFSAVYKSATVNTDTGLLELTEPLEGDTFTAENVQAGYGFVAASLGADGVKKFGRVTKVTKFVKGGQSYVWDKYSVKYTATPTSDTMTQDLYIRTTADDKNDTDAEIDRHPYFTGEISLGHEDYVLYYGSIPVLDENGNVVDVQDKKSFSKTIKVGYNEETVLNLPAGAQFVVGYRNNRYTGLQKVTDVFCASNLRAVTQKSMFEQDEGDEVVNFWEVTVYLKGYLAAAEVKNGGVRQGKVTSASLDYPEDGYRGGSWYVLQGQYDSLDYYGFDYDLIAPDDGFAAGESGWEKVNFREGDTVEITGCVTKESNNKTATIRGISEKEVDGVAVHVLHFDGGVFSTGTEEGPVTITRKVPNLSIICESQNRLWGAEGNTIYASALGDPTNFFTYDGRDTDSYSAAVASEGVFTGCIGFGNSVLFFKEDRLYKVLGSYPSQYTMYEYQVPGVKKGSESSLWNINEVLYYHSREGVYRYGGGSPELISEVFGLRRYQNASAGAEGDRYYISMEDIQSKTWGLWAYDIQRDIWLQEDETQALDFAYNDGRLYFISKDGSVVCVNPVESNEDIAWSATTCRMDEVLHNRKCYSKLLLRAELLDSKAWLQVEVSCDGEPFKRVYTSRDKRAKTLVIPIMPRRCDSFRVRLSGEGAFILRSMVREFDIGSIY